jgi:hypothetical protein
VSDETERKALTRNRPARGDYAVGYGKPPKATRFKPGVSGNPRGRPKGSQNRRPALHGERLNSIILDEAYRTIDVRDGDRTVTVPMAQAIVRSLAVNAAKGRARAQELFTALLAEVERANRKRQDQFIETMIEYKVEWTTELERRARLGIEGPEPLPHPDHIEIDMRAGCLRIRGPMTREEKENWDWLHARKREFAEEVAALKRELEDDPDHPDRAAIEDDIAYKEKLLATIRNALPG